VIELMMTLAGRATYSLNDSKYTRTLLERLNGTRKLGPWTE
jgi:hypothetical protein